MSKWLGPLVRLEGISITQLPPGGNSVSSSTVAGTTDDDAPSATNIKSFLTAVLAESIPFIDGVAPKTGTAPTWKKKGAPKHFSESEAAVEIYEFTVSGKELDNVTGINKLSADRSDEKWFCRRSCHRNAADKRTASWEEFVHSFKEHHAASEDAFTPTVIGAREAITWDTSGITLSSHGSSWVQPSLSVVEMKHKIDPKPLKNRTFPVVQVTASLADTDEFLVVSIPITDFNKSPACEFAKDKSLVVGMYASIERIRVLPTSGEIEWIMATVSDARGVLPQWMQNLAVPGMVAHDVEMFLSWIPSTRKETEQKTPGVKNAVEEKSLPQPPVKEGGESVVSVPPVPISKEVPASSQHTEEIPKASEVQPTLSRRESMQKKLPPAPN